MIGKKCGKNGVKKFVFVHSKAQFDKINPVNECYMEDKRQKGDQQIIVPKYYEVQPIKTDRNSQIPPNYVKTVKARIFISKLAYELDSTDICFLESKYPLISRQFFINILVQLQKSAAGLQTQFDYYAIINRCFSPNAETILQTDTQRTKAVFRNIYCYWRNKRKNMRSPLLREYWIKNQIGPYKSRQCENYNNLYLRNRVVKVEVSDIKQILQQDLLMLKAIFQVMKNRQILEKQLINIQVMSFQKKCQRVLKKITRLEKRSQKQKQKNDKKLTKLMKIQQRNQREANRKKSDSESLQETNQACNQFLSRQGESGYQKRDIRPRNKMSNSQKKQQQKGRRYKKRIYRNQSKSNRINCRQQISEEYSIFEQSMLQTTKN